MGDIVLLSGCNHEPKTTSPNPPPKPKPQDKNCPERTFYVPAGNAKYNNIDTKYLAGGTGDRIGYTSYAKDICVPKGPVLDRKTAKPTTSISYKDAKAYCASEGKRLPKEEEIINAYRKSSSKELRSVLSFMRTKPFLWLTDKNSRGKLFRVGFERTEYSLQIKRVETSEDNKGSKDTSFFCVADPTPPSTFACDKGAKTQKITFIHTNDIHASFTPEDWGGNPVARISGYCKKSRKENPFTICTNGGDIYEKGDITELISSGRTTRAVFGALGFDVSVIGNHDFAWSLKEFFAYSRTPRTHMLGSNVKYIGTNPSEYGGLDYVIADVGCVRIGYFGMVSKGYDERDELTDQDYYPEALKTRHDYVQRAKEMVAKLKDKVDLVVMVSHIGFENDVKLVKEVSGIDVVLSAHSHDVVEKIKRVGNTLLFEAGAYSKYIGDLELIFDLKKRRIKKHEYTLWENNLFNAIFRLPSDEEVRKNINSMVQMWAPEDEFAYLNRTLEDKSAIAGVVGKSILYHLKAKKDIDVQAALVDRKTVWVDKWEKGALTLEDLADSFKVERQPAGTPGFSSFYTVEVSGAELDAIRLKSVTDPRWVYNGPSDPRPEETYTLALPKKVAFNLEHYMGIDERKPQHACEIWEAVHTYGQYRTEKGVCIDDDVELEQCAPE